MISDPQFGQAARGKKRILIFCDYYLPSEKSGGGVWTVVNLVQRFGGRCAFFIVTRNHDNRNDLTPFSSVHSGKWNMVGNAKVMYLAPEMLTIGSFAAIIKEVRPDGVFLNSFFSTPCVKFLLARRRGHAAALPVVLAPCGELSPGAIDLKAWKKRPFVVFSKWIGLHRGVIWKASSESESADIRRVIGPGIKPLVAPDLPPATVLPEFDVGQKPEKHEGAVKFVFYSRIARKKNLSFLLERLAALTEGKIELTIAGPDDDPKYLRECDDAIGRLPSNVKAQKVGALPYLEGLKLLTRQHFLILPTLNENFGYVLLEAMAAGCPVIVSDKTIWNQIASKNAGWVVPLDRHDEWETVLRRCVNMDQSEYIEMSKSARRFAVDWLQDPAHEQAIADVLKTAYGIL